MAFPKIAAVLLAVGLIVGLLGGIGISSVVPTHEATVHPSYNKLLAEQITHFHIAKDSFAPTYEKIAMMTTPEAEAAGYVMLGECVPGMGIHYAKMGPEGPLQPILMFDAQGNMIGMALESLSEQPVPPWENLPQGHPEMEFEHWVFHTYFTHEPAQACEAI